MAESPKPPSDPNVEAEQIILAALGPIAPSLRTLMMQQAIEKGGGRMSRTAISWLTGHVQIMRELRDRLDGPPQEPTPQPTASAQPDWSKWGQMIEATVQEAVALSCNFPPEILVGAGITDRSIAGEFARRSAITQNHILAGKLNHWNRMTADHKVLDHIVLAEFAAWAPTVGFSLPEGFPGARPPGPAANATVQIQLPHLPDGLRKLFDVMRVHWADYRSRGAPKQTEVAADLDRAFGWNATNEGKPSRNAETLASLIRPDELADADPRARGRRKPPR